MVIQLSEKHALNLAFLLIHFEREIWDKDTLQDLFNAMVCYQHQVIPYVGKEAFSEFENNIMNLANDEQGSDEWCSMLQQMKNNYCVGKLTEVVV